MIKLIETTLKITQGDTGPLVVAVTGATLGSGDKLELTFADREKNKLLQKIVDFSSNVATVEFENADTADMASGAYLWQIRIVKGATVADGKITGWTDICTPFDDPLPLRIMEALSDIGATAAGGD